MIVHDVTQGTPEWFALRVGLPTASNFDKIITPKTGELSKSSKGYALTLAVEKLLNQSMEDVSKSQYMDRGTALEPQAVKLFEFQESLVTTPVGFITTDDERIGASPDRLVGEDGLLEVKCPAPHTHLGYLVYGFGADYWPQIQGQLFVAERDWCTRISYHPEMPMRLERVNRDEPYIRKLRDALDQFLDQLDEITAKAKELGVIEAAKQVITPAEAAYGEEAERKRTRAPFLHTILDPFTYGDDRQLPFEAG